MFSESIGQILRRLNCKIPETMILQYYKNNATFSVRQRICTRQVKHTVYYSEGETHSCACTNPNITSNIQKSLCRKFIQNIYGKPIPV